MRGSVIFVLPGRVWWQTRRWSSSTPGCNIPQTVTRRHRDGTRTLHGFVFPFRDNCV